MKAYSLDLREKIVNYVNKGGTRAKAAEVFGVGLRTVYRLLAAHKGGRLKPKASWGRWRKVDPARLREEVGRSPDATLAELGEALGACAMAVCHALRRLGITRKKKRRSTRRGANSSGASSGCS